MDIKHYQRYSIDPIKFSDILATGESVKVREKMKVSARSDKSFQVQTLMKDGPNSYIAFRMRPLSLDQFGLVREIVAWVLVPEFLAQS